MNFPPALHRIVKSWYAWEEVHFRKMGGPVPQKGLAEEKDNQEFDWGAKPPSMTDDRELCFIDDNQYYFDKKSRSSRERYWMFRRFEDTEKYTLFLISQPSSPAWEIQGFPQLSLVSGGPKCPGNPDKARSDRSSRTRQHDGRP